MKEVVYIYPKKFFKGPGRSIDIALRYLKDNLELQHHRWIQLNGDRFRIGFTSLKNIVIPQLDKINLAIASLFPGFKAFTITKQPWLNGGFHTSITRNPDLMIQEDKNHFYLTIKMDNNESDNRTKRPEEKG